MFYKATGKSVLQERLDAERVSEEEAVTVGAEELADVAGAPLFIRPSAAKPSTFEVELQEAWMQP